MERILNVAGAKDASILRAAALAWPFIYRALKDGLGDPAPVFDALCSWRERRLDWRPQRDQSDRLAAHFVIEAALRLALLDWVHMEGSAVERAALARSDCRSKLALSEMLSISKPLEMGDASAAVEQVTAQWREPGTLERERSSLGLAAYALVLRRSAGETSESTTVNLELLRSAQRCSTLCACRDILRHEVRDAAEVESGELESTIASWALERSQRVHSESTGRAFVEALILDRIDPATLPDVDATTAYGAISSSTPVSALLTQQRPAAATRAADASRPGIKAFPSFDGRDRTILMMCMFNHAALQQVGAQWAAGFTASDARPIAALERLKSYKKDSAKNPPPLLLLLDNDVVAIYKSSPPTRHATIDGALGAWVRHALAHPTFGARYGPLLKAVSTPIVAPAPMGVTLPLVGV